MEQSILQNKSFDLSVMVYKRVTELQKKQKEFLLSQWWVECITSVALQMYLLQNIHTKNGFSINLYTARKAAFKGIFWTKLLTEVGGLSKEDANDIEVSLTELIKMLQSSINTVNNNRKKRNEEEPIKDIS